MLGALIGDIIGSPYERHNTSRLDFLLFDSSSHLTDDSVLTIATADAILNGIDFATSYRKWFDKYPQAGYGPGFMRWAADISAPAYGSIGNGSAMRVSPIGEAYHDLCVVERVAKRSADVTHNTDEGRGGAAFMAMSVWHMRRCRDKAPVLDLARAFGLKIKPVDVLRREGKHDYTCRGSIPAAVAAFMEGGSFEEVVRLAVSIGGDSDTIASMAGALAEAYHGIPVGIAEEALRYIPDDMLTVLNVFCSNII